MTREDAYYERIKLLCGYWETYDEWLNEYLENEEPLSDIVLELVDCGDNIKEVERCLNLYCLEKPFDEESVYTRLRLELCDRYEQNTMSRDNVVTALYRFSCHIPFLNFSNDCSVLSEYYELAELGILDMQKFDTVLRRWLKNGGAFNIDEMVYKDQESL